MYIKEGNDHDSSKGHSMVKYLKGNVALTKGNMEITKGNTVLTKGNMVLTKGNTALTKGNMTLTKGSMARRLANRNGNILFFMIRQIAAYNLYNDRKMAGVCHQICNIYIYIYILGMSHKMVMKYMCSKWDNA